MPNSKVVRAGIGYTIGNYLLKGFSFITVPIFARLLSQEDFGIYSSFVAYETILFVIQGCAIHSSYNSAKYRFQNDDNPGSLSYNGYVSTTVALILCNTIVLLGITVLFSDFFSTLLKLTPPQLLLLVLYSFGTAVVTCFNTDASLNYNYKRYLLVAGINAAFNLSLSILLILTVYSSQRYMGRILGTVIPMFGIAVVIVLLYFRKEKPAHQRQYLKWGLSYSIPIIFHGLSQVILSQFDRIMIRNMVGDAEAGIYSFGYTIFSIINVTINSLGAVWTPWFYEKMNNGESKEIRKYSSYYALGILAICLALILTCPELIVILGSSKYVEAKYCTIPIIASGYFVFLYTLPSGIEYYYEKTKYIAMATMAAAGINVILNYYCIIKFGYVAAAYTTLVTYILYFTFHYFIARKIEGAFLFSNKVIGFASAAILVIMGSTLNTLNHMAIRWIMAFLIMGLAFYFEERKLGFIDTVLNKLKK